MDPASSIVWRDGGHLVRILTGATRGDLRAQRPTTFEWVTPLETTKALDPTLLPWRRRIG